MNFPAAVAIELAHLDHRAAQLAALRTRIDAATDPDVRAEYQARLDRLIELTR